MFADYTPENYMRVGIVCLKAVLVLRACSRPRSDLAYARTLTALRAVRASSLPAMFIDLNVPVPYLSQQHPGQASSKKGKGKQVQNVPAMFNPFTPAQVAALESRIDMLVHCQSPISAMTSIHPS